MSKHTPGPWFVDEANPDLVQTATGDYICEVNPFSFSLSNLDEDQCEANARLIAAAPELLEVLRGVLKIDRGTSGRIIIEGWQEEVIRATITKATGEHHGN